MEFLLENGLDLPIIVEYILEYFMEHGLTDGHPEIVDHLVEVSREEQLVDLVDNEQEERDLFVGVVGQEDVLEEEDDFVIEVVLVREVDDLEYLLDCLGRVGLVDAIDELVDVLHQVHFSQLLFVRHVL